MNFIQLPIEIQLMCINYLELKEMCMVSETCSFMYNLTKEQLYQKKIKFHKEILLDMIEYKYQLELDIRYNFVVLLAGMQGIEFGS